MTTANALLEGSIHVTSGTIAQQLIVGNDIPSYFAPITTRPFSAGCFGHGNVRELH